MIYLKSLNSGSGGMKDMEKSITLIGLPGCGKTTVGNLLSDKLKYEFVDMDFYIENKQQKSIIELFRNGEDYFRNIETETCKVLGEKSKTIISSGGGVIKKSINIEYLKKNSIVMRLQPQRRSQSANASLAARRQRMENNILNKKINI